MPRLPRFSIAQSFLLLAFVAFLTTLCVDYWRKAGTGVTYNNPVVALSPNGETLAFNASFRPLFQGRHPIILKSTTSGQLVKTLESHSWVVADLEWSNDGNRLFSCSGDRTLRSWQPGTGEQIDSFQDSVLAATNMSLSPDERIFAVTVGADIYIVDWESKSILQKLTGHPRTVETTAFSPDGQYLVSVGIDRNLFVWDTESWTRVTAAKATGSPKHFEFSNGGDLILGGYRSNTGTTPWKSLVEVRGLPSLQVKRSVPVESYAAVSSIALSADGSRLAAAHGGDKEKAHSAVTIWDMESMAELQTLEIDDHGELWIDAMEFSKDGEQLYCASMDGKVTVQRWETGDSDVVFQRPSFRWKFATAGALICIIVWMTLSRRRNNSLVDSQQISSEAAIEAC